MGRGLHPYEPSALPFSSARPFYNHRIMALPTAEIEVADIKARTLGYIECCPKRWQETEGDVFEDTGHCCLVVHVKPVRDAELPAL